MMTKKIKITESPMLQNPDTSSFHHLKTPQILLSKTYYHEILAYDLLLKQNLSSIMQLPVLDKIVLNTTSKLYVQDKKQSISTLAALELISGQKSQFTFAKNSIANFKIREDQLLGCHVVLQKKNMYLFLEKLSKIVFPRDAVLHKSESESTKKEGKDSQFSKQKAKVAKSFGFQNMMHFPELEKHYELVESFRGLTCTFVMKQATPRLSALLLSGFQLPHA